MSQNRKRRTWSAEDKLRIVLGAMQPGVEVSDLCRREGVNPVLHYAWKKQLLGYGRPVGVGPPARRPILWFSSRKATMEGDLTARIKQSEGQ